MKNITFEMLIEAEANVHAYFSLESLIDNAQIRTNYDKSYVCKLIDKWIDHLRAAISTGNTLTELQFNISADILDKIRITSYGECTYNAWLRLLNCLIACMHDKYDIVGIYFSILTYGLTSEFDVNGQKVTIANRYDVWRALMK